MSRDNNVIMINGRLTRDVEIRHTQSGMAIAKLSIANNRDYKENKKVNYFDVSAFGGVADICYKYLTKGSQVSICDRTSPAVAPKQ